MGKTSGDNVASLSTRFQMINTLRMPSRLMFIAFLGCLRSRQVVTTSKNFEGTAG